MFGGAGTTAATGADLACSLRQESARSCTGKTKVSGDCHVGSPMHHSTWSAAAAVDPAVSARGPKTLFIGCAEEERELLRELEKHLSVLARSSVMTVTSSHDTLAGDVRDDVLRERLLRADLILFLVSPSFLAADWHNQEVLCAIELHRAGRARVVPIIVRACLWQNTSLGALVPLPRAARAVAQHGDLERDAVWVEIVEELFKPALAPEPSSGDTAPPELVTPATTALLDVRLALASYRSPYGLTADGWADALGCSDVPRDVAIRPMVHVEESCHVVLFAEAQTASGAALEIEVFFPDPSRRLPGAMGYGTALAEKAWCGLPERPLVEVSREVARWRLSLVASAIEPTAILASARARSGPEDEVWMAQARAFLDSIRAPDSTCEDDLPLMTALAYGLAPSTRAVRLVGRPALRHAVEVRFL